MSLLAKNITVRYGARTILFSLDAEICPGKVTVLIGPNGSGKSTLIRSFAKALRPLSGEIMVDGKNLYQMRGADTASCIAYVPQENPIGYAFTVTELVGLGIGTAWNRANKKNRNRATDRVDSHDLKNNRLGSALISLDLLSLKDRSVLKLSGGERQRAAIARGFAQNSNYLLLDEPTAHLDLQYQVTLLSALQNLAHNQNTGVLLALHDLNLAAEWADYMLLMHHGRIVAAGTSEAVLTAERIETVYGTPVQVLRNPVTGSPWVQAISDTFALSSNIS